MSSSQSLRPSTAQGAIFDDKPLWNHVQVVTVADGGGGNRTWVCNYCNKRVVGSYTKVKGHLMRLPRHNVEGCSAISDEILEAIKKEYEAAEAKKAELALNARKKAEYLSIPEGSDLLQQKKRKGMAPQGALPSAFNVAQRDVADKEAARMFYASGLPFNFARSPYFRKYSLTLANSRLAGYVPPSYNRLRTTLLAQEKEHVNRLLQPIKDTWRKKGVSLVSDGWSDRQRRPLINIMAASSRGSMFVKAIDASGNTKDAEYVANLFVQTINDLGEANVVQIVTDNASNYKAAGLTIEAKYPHVFWTPCVVHSLNLALKSICEPGEKSPQYAQFARCQSDSDVEFAEVAEDAIEGGDLGIIGDDVQDFGDGSFSPAPGVETVCVFPKNPSRSVVAGEESELLVGLKNEGELIVNVIAIKASVHLPYDHRMPVQNLTAQAFNNASVPPSAQATFPYIFAVSKFLQAGTFDLVGTIVYEIDQFPFQSTFYNGTFEVTEAGGPLRVESVFLFCLGISLLGLLGLWIHGQIQHLSKKTKRAPKVEVGTKTTDASMDEWLQACFYENQASN